MKSISRRTFIKGTAAGSLLISSPLALAAASKATVVIVGGGFGGASCAMKLKKLAPTLNVVLVEPNAHFYTCPFSNFVIGGMSKLNSVKFNYNKLKSAGIKIVVDTVKNINHGKKQMILAKGGKLKYDKAVISPGIDFINDALEGYTAKDANTIPHAYKAGSQTELLRKQLSAMKDGGVFGILPPGNPFRCPPGPYERASVVASYFKKHKPKSKILIFDAKEKFSKQSLFTKGWGELYGDMIQWYSGSAGGKIASLDVKNRVVTTEFGEETLDVINYIPPQKAGKIAHTAGLTNAKGWCPINDDFTSKKHDNIYVIGDAAIAGAMPKSGFSANNQGKYVAYAIVRSLQDKPMFDLKLNNTCFSYVGDDYSISVIAVYDTAGNKIKKITGGTTKIDASAQDLKLEASYAKSWYAAITTEMFG